MREVRSIGRSFSAEIEVVEECKYTASAEAWDRSKRIKYVGIVSWEIVNGVDAEQIEAETDESGIDEYHEYLVLNFEDGETATFRNSHVDMHRVA